MRFLVCTLDILGGDTIFKELKARKMGHTVPGGTDCGQCIHNQGPGAGGVFSHYVEKAQCEDRWEEVTPHSVLSPEGRKFTSQPCKLLNYSHPMNSFSPLLGNEDEQSVMVGMEKR